LGKYISYHINIIQFLSYMIMILNYNSMSYKFYKTLNYFYNS